MEITLSPMAGLPELRLERHGDTLIINGSKLDLSAIPEGATLPNEAVASEYINGPITREGGTLRLVVVLPHGWNAPEETRFPAPLTLTHDGPVALPPYDKDRPNA